MVFTILIANYAFKIILRTSFESGAIAVALKLHGCMGLHFTEHLNLNLIYDLSITLCLCLSHTHSAVAFRYPLAAPPLLLFAAVFAALSVAVGVLLLFTHPIL